MKSIPVVAVLGLKGGAGKSTLTIHLAVAAQAEGGRRVFIADTDPQATSLAWAKARDLSEPAVMGVRAYELASAIARAAENYDLAVVDTAPRIEADVPTLAKAASLIVIPVRPSMPDLVASQAAFRLARASGKPFVVVLNAVNVRTIETTEARTALAAHYDVAPVMLGQRVAYARALASGRAVTEFEPRGEAAEEITQLWKYLQAKL